MRGEAPREGANIEPAKHARAHPSKRSAARIQAEFEERLARGERLRITGAARSRPARLLSADYLPHHRIDLFDTTFYLSDLRQNPDIRFFVSYVVQPHWKTGRVEIHPRIFYKDVSLVWRSASHYIRSRDENWIGKGEVRRFVVDGYEEYASVESTTDLPLEIQAALEEVCRGAKEVPEDQKAISLVLRRGPDNRIEPYRDFMAPRIRARERRGGLINGGRSVARFTRAGDPGSLVIKPGYEPDFGRGIVERGRLNSRMYGGRLRRTRILSVNRKIQYLFFAGPRHVWIIPPQATTTELTSYGVRAIDVVTDEDLCLPGFEYHFMDESQDPPALYTQIPAGFAGAPCEADESRADASAWLDRIPLIQEFRRRGL